MDYKEFEYINRSHVYFGAYNEYTKIWFVYNPNNYRQRHFVEKYKNLTPNEFDKMWLPLCEKQKIIRNQRLEEFKNLKSSAFSKMSLEKKMQYIDALTATKRTTEEWDTYFTPKVKDNLRACLLSMKPSKKFLLEEQRDLNHFMNALLGTGLSKTIKETSKKSLEQQKQDMHNFVDLFCKVYKIDRPDLHFKELPASIGASAGLTLKSEDGINFSYNYLIEMNELYMQNLPSNDLKNFEFLYHELIHVRQIHLLFFDKKEHPYFSKAFDKLNQLTSDTCFNLEIDTLTPKESHAYYMQRKFEEQCDKRIFNYNARQNNFNFPQFSRVLWYDYQRR